jgi:putative copper resistance protein D
VSLSPWDAAAIAVKALTYAATLGAAGAALFLHYCGALIAAPDRLRIRLIVLGLSPLAVFAGAAQIMVSAGSMSGDAAGMLDGSLIHMVWHAGAGRANVIRAIGLMVVALAVLPGRPSWWVVSGAVLAATSFAWTGHARSLHPDVLPVLLLSVHLLGAAFWLGALAPLLIVARDGDQSRIAATVVRFGAAAVVVVGGLMAAGAILLWMMLGNFTALWSSAYGRYMTFKLLLVACILCLAAFNKLRLTPRLRRGEPQALRSLRTSIRLELLLGILILAVTATFTTVSGPPVLTQATTMAPGSNGPKEV